MAEKPAQQTSPKNATSNLAPWTATENGVIMVGAQQLVELESRKKLSQSQHLLHMEGRLVRLLLKKLRTATPTLVR